MSKVIDSFIARQLIEVKFNKRIFSFIDFKGSFTDMLITDLGFEQITMSGNRVDLSKLNNKEKVFYSWENFGVQLEESEGFHDLKEKISSSVNMIEKFNKFEIKDISRIGTRTSTLYHIKNKTLEDIRASFDKVFFNRQQLFEKKSGIEITDNGLFLMDLNVSGYKVHVTMGATTKQEAISKFFQIDNYNKFKYDHGLFIDIDLFVNSYNFSNLSVLKNDLISQIDELDNLQGKLIEVIKEA